MYMYLHAHPVYSSYTNECVHKRNNGGIYFNLYTRLLSSFVRQNAALYVKSLDLFPIAVQWFVCCSSFNFAFTKINYFRIPVMICVTFVRYFCLCYTLTAKYPYLFALIVYYFLFRCTSRGARFCFFILLGVCFFCALFNLSILMPNIFSLLFVGNVAKGNFSDDADGGLSVLLVFESFLLTPYKVFLFVLKRRAQFSISKTRVYGCVRNQTTRRRNEFLHSPTNEQTNEIVTMLKLDLLKYCNTHTPKKKTLCIWNVETCVISKMRFNRLVAEKCLLIVMTFFSDAFFSLLFVHHFNLYNSQLLQCNPDFSVRMEC